MKYLHERRRQLGGYMPERKVPASQIQAPPLESFADLLGGSRRRIRQPRWHLFVC